jgi:hypothetical protein
MPRTTVSAPLPPAEPSAAVLLHEETMRSGKRRKVRFWIMLASAVFFVVALMVSAALMFWGGNTISGENISLVATGPVQAGGGEEYQFRIAIGNQNTVPIQAATLIIEYPRGTLSVSDPGRELGIERRSLDAIEPGELVNIDLGARVFGGENEEREIKVRIEYRIDGSNATFEKRAEPLRFKIGTSPLVLTLTSVKSVASGQEVELSLEVQSNAPAPLSDTVVRMTYPNGFDFTDADPAPISGESVWRIDTLDPGEKRTITVRGLLTGFEDELRTFDVAAGVSKTDNRNEIASQLAQTRTDVSIEKPFLAINMSINGNSNDTVVVGKGETALVNLTFRNTLDTVIYDGEVVVTLGGNALSRFEVDASTGFYDSSENTITWIGAEEESLREIVPGATNSFTFSVTPENTIGNAAELTLDVAVKGKRIFDERPEEQIDGALARVIKIESIPRLTGDVFHRTGIFTNSGPVPPVAGTVTQYTLTLRATAGANDLTGADVTAMLPQYVNWLDLVSDDDTVTYNSTSRTLTWTIGDLKAGQSVDMSTQVSFRPSTAQVGRTPTLLDMQRFRATDRFTGTVVRTDHPALTTRISNGDGEEELDGEVVAP